jgi:hypothetical protein
MYATMLGSDVQVGSREKDCDETPDFPPYIYFARFGCL